MSDGGINMDQAFGFHNLSLSNRMLVEPDAINRINALSEALGMTVERAESILAGEPGRERDRVATLAHQHNREVELIWNIKLGMGKQAPRTATERRRKGLTKWMTPKEFDEVKEKLRRVKIPHAAFTNDMWVVHVEKLMAFLVDGELPDGVSMDKNIPMMSRPKAINLIWYIQEVMGLIHDEIDICDECGRVLDTAGETHDWCSKCGKMRCEYCTEAPYECECDYPCAKHCECKGRSRRATGGRPGVTHRRKLPA